MTGDLRDRLKSDDCHCIVNKADRRAILAALEKVGQLRKENSYLKRYVEALKSRLVAFGGTMRFDGTAAVGAAEQEALSGVKQ